MSVRVKPCHTVTPYRPRFQYNDCVGSSSFLNHKQFLYCISIQRLCRFEKIAELEKQMEGNFNTTIVSVRGLLNTPSKKDKLVFQYNDCVGSSKNRKSSPQVSRAFQYNDCVGSSGLKLNITNVVILFQYNDCVGSSFLYTILCDASKISIQRLCRFELCLI